MRLCFQLIVFRFAKHAVAFRARKDRCLRFCTFLNDTQRIKCISLTRSFKEITCSFDNMFHKVLAAPALISLATFISIYSSRPLYFLVTLHDMKRGSLFCGLRARLCGWNTIKIHPVQYNVLHFLLTDE